MGTRLRVLPGRTRIPRSIGWGDTGASREVRSLLSMIRPSMESSWSPIRGLIVRSHRSKRPTVVHVLRHFAVQRPTNGATFMGYRGTGFQPLQRLVAIAFLVGLA